MPKRLHEIKNFHVGTVTTHVDTDIPEDSATYSLNIDPITEGGVLKGIPYDEIRHMVVSGSDNSPSGNPEANGAVTLKLDSLTGFATSGSVIFIDSLGVTQLLAYTGKDSESERLTGLTGWTGTGTLLDNTTVYESISSTYDSSRSTMINNDGTRHIVYYEASDTKIKKIDNYYSAYDTTVQAELSLSAESVTGVPCMEKNNKEVHIGMGNGVLNVPRWAGIISHGQFGGSAPSGLQLKNAELEGPTLIPNFHKVVNDGTYIYGIEWGGFIIYKLRISDYSLVEKKLIIPLGGSLPEWSALTLASDGDLWLFSLATKDYGSDPRVLGEWYKVGATSLDIITSGSMTIDVTTHNSFSTFGYVGPDSTPVVGNIWVITDMIEIGSYLWFGGATGITGNDLQMYGKVWLLNKVSSAFTSGSTVALTSANKRAFLTQEGGTETTGGYFELGYSGTPLQAHAIIPPICLVDPKHSGNEYVGICMEWYKADGTSLHNTPGGLGIREKSGAATAAVVGIGTAIMSVKYDQTQTTVPSNWATWLTGGDVVTTSGRIRSVSGCSIATVYTVVNASTSYYTDIYSHEAYDHDTDYTGGAVGEMTVALQDAGGSADDYDFNKGVGVATTNSSNFNYHIFSGSGVGRWGSQINVLGISTITPRLESNVSLTLTENASVSSIHTTGRKYYYKTSYIYDGYQESPLSDYTTLTSTGKQVEVAVKVHNATNISTRITHINLYMGDSVGTGNSPDGFYRIVQSLDVDKAWDSFTDPALAPDWGSYYTKLYVHSTSLRASYEAITGISEILDDTIVNYGLSAQLNSQLFVTRCYHANIDNATNYLFKSKPYKFDQFDWTTDFLILPTYPTAIKAFKGRIYVFDENNMYRIEPNSLYIEDTWEGVGCLSQDSIYVSEYGMCFADKNNVYLHDGTKPNPISVPISSGDTTYSWQNIDSTFSPKVIFYNKMKCFIIFFKTTGGLYYTWSYNMVMNRWDLWRNLLVKNGTQETAEPKSVMVGKDGELIVSCNSKVYEIINDPVSVKPWDWESKKLTLGQDTQIKRFNNFNVTGSPSGTLGNASTGITVKVDGSATTESGTLASFTIATTEASGKQLQWVLSGQTGTVDALGAIYRRKIVTAEQ